MAGFERGVTTKAGLFFVSKEEGFAGAAMMAGFGRACCEGGLVLCLRGVGLFEGNEDVGGGGYCDDGGLCGRCRCQRALE